MNPITIQNALSSTTINKLKQISFDEIKHRCNLTSWKREIVGMSGAILLWDVDKELEEQIKKELSPYAPWVYENSTWQIAYTLAGRLSYIPFHTDGSYIAAITVYLNETWDKDFAGAFVYQDKDCFKAVFPEYNKAIILKPPIPHCTMMPNIHAPMRETLQVFIKRND